MKIQGKNSIKRKLEELIAFRLLSSMEIYGKIPFVVNCVENYTFWQTKKHEKNVKSVSQSQIFFNFQVILSSKTRLLKSMIFETSLTNMKGGYVTRIEQMFLTLYYIYSIVWIRKIHLEVTK